MRLSKDMQDSLRFHTRSVAETEKLGARLATLLGAGDVVFLIGDLGAGKTSFARGAVQALVPDAQDVTSPTYNLVHVWEGADFEVWHADLYRLENPRDVEELGLLDAFDHAVCLIEWPDRLGGFAPDDRLDVLFVRKDDHHEVQFRFANAAWKERLHGL